MDLPANQYRIVYLDFERLKLKLSTLNASQRERLWKTFATDIEQFGPRLIQTKKATRINSDLIEYR